MQTLTRTFASFAFAFAAATGTASATDFGHHPAVHTATHTQGIDANKFIVLPPAATQWVRAHANADHPAVVAARAGAPAAFDTNAFLVQPPASVTWTHGPAQIAQPVATIASVGAR